MPRTRMCDLHYVGPSVPEIFRDDFFTRMGPSVSEILRGDFHPSGSICAGDI